MSNRGDGNLPGFSRAVVRTPWPGESELLYLQEEADAMKAQSDETFNEADYMQERAQHLLLAKIQLTATVLDVQQRGRELAGVLAGGGEDTRPLCWTSSTVAVNWIFARSRSRNGKNPSFCISRRGSRGRW
jgi:hypothetical protein